MMNLVPNGTFTHLGEDAEGSATKKKAIARNLGSRSSDTRVTRGSASKEGEFQSVSSQNPMRNTNMSNLPIEVDLDPLLKDIGFLFDDKAPVPQNPHDKEKLMSIYRDMYYHDPIPGSCVDLYSTLPFSDFTLGGVNNKKILNEYMETIERLNARTLLTELSVDHLVTGTFLSTLMYDKDKKVFIDILPHKVEDAEIRPLPFYSQDPIIRLTTPVELREIFNDPSPRIAALKETLGPSIVDTLMQEKVELDPLNTVYIPRKTFSSSQGTSYFRRVLPIWLIEKNLFRGTLVESSRRQRGILHLVLGDGEFWEPNVEDMNFMTELFMNADADPLGAIIATRQGVEAQEMRQGGDFWKITDIWDSTSTFKLRALGISESFLSGDANYSTAEASMTVFIESLRAYRDNITRKLFYNKIFPLVSLVNGYTVSPKGKILKKDDLLSGNIENILSTLQDGSKLLIPNIHWNKQLKPEGDANYLDMLRNLTELGVPVPLRAFAAAGGFNLDEILQQQEEDTTIQKRILEYSKAVADMKKEFGGGEDDEGGMFASAGTIREAADRFANENRHMPFYSASMGTKSRSSVHGQGKRMTLLDRNFGEAAEIVGRTRTGKPKHIIGQARAQEKTNRVIAKSLKSISKNKDTPLTRRSTTLKKQR